MSATLHPDNALLVLAMRVLAVAHVVQLGMAALAVQHLASSL